MTSTTQRGDADIARAAALFAEPARAKVLMALADGRALSASVLASEAGVSAPAVSAHLTRLRAAGLLTVEPSGRHRYYRLAGPEVASVLEALALIAPTTPIRSLRQDTRAHALRQARTCYDHLAGRLGVAVTAALIDRGALVRVNGQSGTYRHPGDPLSAPLPNHPYRLGTHAAAVLAPLGIDLDTLTAARTRRPLLRFCVDWSEQRHHLAGQLGAAMTHNWIQRGWLTRHPNQRAVTLTNAGTTALDHHLGLHHP